MQENQKKLISLDRRIISPQNNSVLFRLFRSEVIEPSKIDFEHNHTAFEISMVLEGAGTYSTQLTDFEYKKGDIFCFSNDEGHKITKLSEKSAFLTFHFEPRFVWSDRFGMADHDLLASFLVRKEHRRNKLENTNEITQKIRELMFDTEREFEEQKPHFYTAVRVNLMTVLIELSRGYDFSEKFKKSSVNSGSAHCIERAINYIDENLEYDIELGTLSEIAKMSKNYFCSLFKKLNGISPWEYITIKRIERAIEYIKTTEYTKLEIATKCGFNNTSNFYHAFKKVTGKTPGDYLEKEK